MFVWSSSVQNSKNWCFETFCSHTYYTPPPQKKKNTKLVQFVTHFRSLNPQLCREDLSSLRGAIDLTFHLCTLDPTTNSTSPALLEGKGWNTTVHCRGAMLRNVYGTHVNCAIKNAFCGKKRMQSIVEQKACKKNKWAARVIRWELKEHHAKRSSQINTNYNHAVSMCYTQISGKKILQPSQKKTSRVQYLRWCQMVPSDIASGVRQGVASCRDPISVYGWGKQRSMHWTLQSR